MRRSGGSDFVNVCTKAYLGLTKDARRKPRPSGPGEPGRCVDRRSLLLDVLADDAQRGPVAGRGGVGRRPEVPVHDVAVHAAGEPRSQPPGRHALERVHQAARLLRRVLNDQVHVVVFAVELAQAAPESPQAFRTASSQHRSMSTSSTPRRYFGHEDQMNVECGNRTPASAAVSIECHRPVGCSCRAGQIPVPPLPVAGTAAGPGAGVRLRASGVQRLPARPGGVPRPRGEDQRHGGAAPGDHPGQATLCSGPGSGRSRRSPSCRPARTRAVPTRTGSTR